MLAAFVLYRVQSDMSARERHAQTLVELLDAQNRPKAWELLADDNYDEFLKLFTNDPPATVQLPAYRKFVASVRGWPKVRARMGAAAAATGAVIILSLVALRYVTWLAEFDCRANIAITAAIVSVAACFVLFCVDWSALARPVRERRHDRVQEASCRPANVLARDATASTCMAHSPDDVVRMQERFTPHAVGKPHGVLRRYC